MPKSKIKEGSVYITTFVNGQQVNKYIPLEEVAYKGKPLKEHFIDLDNELELIRQYLVECKEEHKKEFLQQQAQIESIKKGFEKMIKLWGENK